jgi:oligoendopeptidase F
MTQQLTRDQVPPELTYDLSHIYATPAEFEADLARPDAQLAKVATYASRLGEGAATLLAALRARDDLFVRAIHLGSYARCHAQVDGTSAEYQAMSERVGGFGARMDAALAFLPSELLALPDGALERYMGESTELVVYRKQLEDLLLVKPYSLSADAERALAALGEALGTPLSVYQRTITADLACPPIEEKGSRLPMSLPRYAGYVQSPDRELRRLAYDSLIAGLERHKNGLATTLAAHIKTNVTVARVRGYGSATEMILAPQRVPEAVYRNVLDTVHDEIAPHMRRLLKYKARRLRLERLRSYDTAAPLDEESGARATFEQGERMIKEGLAVLGGEYAEMLDRAFADRWIERADNVGKRQGANCGGVYGVHPYVFMTWTDRLRNVFTLAHELGHAGHQWLAARSQIVSNTANPWSFLPPTQRFFTEAPSTANELLLGMHVLDTTDDERVRREVVEQFLGTFTHNMVTHMLEAHFERRLYDLAEVDEPITTRTVMDVQRAVFERLYGDALELQPGDSLYWMQQPHFYLGTGLYPIVYAAGLTGAYNVASNIRNQGQPAVDRWLDTLRAGTTRPPLELMANAGVDLASPEPIRRAVAYFGELVSELESSSPA